jgi:hypothetical protein
MPMDLLEGEELVRPAEGQGSREVLGGSPDDEDEP